LRKKDLPVCLTERSHKCPKNNEKRANDRGDAKVASICKTTADDSRKKEEEYG
jgi:hypothetical protein